LPKDIGGKSLRTLVSAGKISPAVNNGWTEFEIASVLDHEVIVIT
jgi:hypothetical protein